jgi:hypothetical protein
VLCSAWSGESGQHDDQKPLAFNRNLAPMPPGDQPADCCRIPGRIRSQQSAELQRRPAIAAPAHRVAEVESQVGRDVSGK